MSTDSYFASNSLHNSILNSQKEEIVAPNMSESLRIKRGRLNQYLAVAFGHFDIISIPVKSRGVLWVRSKVEKIRKCQFG